MRRIETYRRHLARSGWRWSNFGFAWRGDLPGDELCLERDGLGAVSESCNVGVRWALADVEEELSVLHGGLLLIISTSPADPNKQFTNVSTKLAKSESNTFRCRGCGNRHG